MSFIAVLQLAAMNSIDMHTIIHTLGPLVSNGCCHDLSLFPILELIV